MRTRRWDKDQPWTEGIDCRWSQGHPHVLGMPAETHVMIVQPIAVELTHPKYTSWLGSLFRAWKRWSKLDESEQAAWGLIAWFHAGSQRRDETK